jgi:hypothetical protein
MWSVSDVMNCNSCYMCPNCWVADEEWIGMDLEGSCHALVVGNITVLVFSRNSDRPDILWLVTRVR